MRAARAWLSFGALTWAPFVAGQTTLGALLDAGAKPLSAAQFKEEVVQRTIEGPTPTGGFLEVMYAESGTVQGRGTPNYSNSTAVFGRLPVDGEWKLGDNGRICTTLRIAGWTSGSTVVMPTRCQYWFKLGDKYFFADSDTDRSAKVLVRTLKQ